MTFPANAMFIEYASDVNPDSGHIYSIYYSPKDPPDFTWPLLDWTKTNDITWFEARDEAEQLNGYLATITTAEEDAFLQSSTGP